MGRSDDRVAWHLSLAITVILAVVGSSRAAGPALAARAAETLGLERCAVFTPAFGQSEDGTMVVAAELDGAPCVFVLTPHASRAADYQILVQGANGALVPVAPGPVQTLRGQVIGGANQRGTAAGAMLDDGLHLRVHIDGGEERWIEPIEKRLADADGAYVAYATADVLPGEGTCATDAEDAIERPFAAQAAGEMAAGASLCVAEIACDADYEYYQNYGSVAAVENRINAIINSMNVQYERDVGITHLITTIIVRTTAFDPYVSTHPSTLLGEFRTEWRDNQTAVPRDVAHLFTGRELDGSTIGIASLSVICSEWSGYGLVEDFSSNFACLTDLSAHEIGHNWGAGHCSCSGFTMNASITCANQFHPTETIPDLIAYRDSRSCLDCGTWCGNGTCDLGEDPCGCPDDCGPPPTIEQNCQDGIDDDCDGDTDCEDVDCNCPTLLGESPEQEYGRAVANAGDVNGDGFDDLIVGAPLDDTTGVDAGRAFVVSGASLRSGASATVLYTFTGAAAGDRFGWAVAGAGDLNADGFADVVVGAPRNDANGNDAGEVYAYSGINGSLLHRKQGKNPRDQFGYAVGGDVDVDDDGHDDFIVGAPRNDDRGTNAGRVYVHSGRTGSRLQTVPGEAAGDQFGWSVAGLGRVDGGGEEDFVVGAPWHDAAGTNAGRVYVLAGDGPDVLYTLDGANASDRFGYSLARLGRVDSDNRTDFVVGSPWYDKGGANNGGRIDVFSGRTGTELWHRSDNVPGAKLGWAVSGAGDVDCDGVPDVMAGAPKRNGTDFNAGAIVVRSGATGAKLADVEGDASDDQFGRAVAGGLADPDDPCRDDVAAGAPFDDTAATDAGAVRVIEF